MKTRRQFYHIDVSVNYGIQHGFPQKINKTKNNFIKQINQESFAVFRH